MGHIKAPTGRAVARGGSASYCCALFGFTGGVDLHGIDEIFHLVAQIIDISVVVILAYGVLKSLIKFVITEVRERLQAVCYQPLQRVRRDTGVYILLALDLLIAADIIETIIAADLDGLIQLGAIVVIRTVIGFFLGREVDQIEREEDPLEKSESTD